MPVRPRHALIAAILLACPAFRASALTMTTWTFSSCVFDDGGSLTGHADYISNGTWVWDITTSTTGVFSGFRFTINNEFESTNFDGIGQPNFEFVANDYSHQLWFYTFPDSSPNSGDTQPAFFKPDIAATYRLFNTGFAQSREIGTGVNRSNRWLVSGTVTGVTTDIIVNPIPNIDTAQSFYGSSALIAGNVNPQFDGGTLRLESSTFIDQNFTASAFSGTIDLYGSNLLLGTDHITGPGGLTIADSLHSNLAPGGTLTLTEVFTYLGSTKISAGAVVKLAPNNSIYGNLPPTALTLNGTFLLNGSTQTLASLSGTDPTATLDLGSGLSGLAINGSATTTYAGKITGAPLFGLTLSGTTNLTLTGPATYTGSTSLAAGTSLTFSGGASSIITFISGQGALTVDSGAAVSSTFVQANSWTIKGTQTIRTNTNTNSTLVCISPIAPAIAHAGPVYTGKLDLNNNVLLIQTTDTTSKATQIASLTAALTAGANGGSWTGNGITSSTAAADPQHLALGLFDNAILGKANVGGRLVDANALIVVILHRGDLNGDGIIDIQDQSLVTNHWQTAQTNWAGGDLNGDGFVDLQDLTSITNNWQQSSNYKIPGPGFALSPDQTTTPIPEPATLLLLSLPLLITRRRKPMGRFHPTAPSDPGRRRSGQPAESP